MKSSKVALPFGERGDQRAAAYREMHKRGAP
jgi:hypothetical protein